MARYSFFWVLQGSILGPLLFTIVFVKLFFVMDYIDVANYAQNNTACVMVNDIVAIIASLQRLPPINGTKYSKNGPNKSCGRQPLKIFTWSILKYFVPNVTY